MSESFNLSTNALKGLSRLQFDKYTTFAFWNGSGAKDVAVASKSAGVPALESSAIGGLFDGFGSCGEFSKGIESTSWGPQLWAELSRAYAPMVIDAIVKDRDKKFVVLCGIGFDNPGYNVCNSIESLTLKMGLDRAKMVEWDLVDATTWRNRPSRPPRTRRQPDRSNSDELTAAMPWNDRRGCGHRVRASCS